MLEVRHVAWCKRRTIYQSRFEGPLSPNLLKEVVDNRGNLDFCMFGVKYVSHRLLHQPQHCKRHFLLRKLSWLISVVFAVLASCPKEMTWSIAWNQKHLIWKINSGTKRKRYTCYFSHLSCQFFLFFLFVIGNQCIQFAKTYDQVCSSDCLC